MWQVRRADGTRSQRQLRCKKSAEYRNKTKPPRVVDKMGGTGLLVTYMTCSLKIVAI
jgi:hypothetical protein